jgi:hypothetical protein
MQASIAEISLVQGVSDAMATQFGRHSLVFLHFNVPERSQTARQDPWTAAGIGT